MGIMTPETYRSAIDQMLNLIPQGHEKAIKNAVYNIIAFIFVLLGVGAGMAVYLILEPFIKPLLWAVLIGSVLYPAKTAAVSWVTNYLQNMINQKTPLIFGSIMAPLSVVDRFTENSFVFLCQKLVTIISITGVVMLAIGIYSYVPFSIFYVFKDGVSTINSFISEFASILSITMILLSGITVLFVFVWTTPSNKIVWRITSHGFWFMLCCYCANFAEGFQFILFPVLAFAFILSFIFGVLYSQFPNDEVGDQAQSKNESPNSVEEDRLIDSRVMLEEVAKKHVSDTKDDEVVNPLGNKSKRKNPFGSSFDGLHAEANVAARNEGRADSWSFIYYVSFLCVFVQLYKYPSLLRLIPLLVVLFLAKKTICFVSQLQVVKEYTNQLWIALGWFKERRGLLLPAPVYHFLKVIWWFDRYLVFKVLSNVHSIVTAGVLSLVVILGTGMLFVVAIQFYTEGVHLVQVTAGLANSTLARYPEAQHMLPKGIDSMMEQVVDNAYSYGREGLVTIIRGAVKESNANTEQLEMQVLELWDRVYRSWLASYKVNAITGDDYPSSSALLSSVGGILENLKKTSELLNVTLLVDFAKQNVGTLMSVVDSLWSVAKANVQIVFNILAMLITVIAGGGTAILNFIINRIIFMTALFYLLSSSGKTYKPVELITSVSPGTGLTLGIAIEEAINTVCLASLKMALFYGLWTWLIHTFFKSGLVIIPSVLAAILSAVPVLGHYWAALPAAIELWLVQDRATDAILLALFQFLPLTYVDTAIYREIKGGGHPYLTGLSIAGGILCFGIEGAIFGPLILCLLLVAIRVYRSVVAETPTNSFPPSQRRLIRLDTIG
ncbi:transmembrane protein 245-like isoform X2 [Artemia franciscana]|uniref:transmembrane protein 245-like isoform X2 n=1 Tax=Artemia franciscana TaxID=6661 RepID=UPI0032DA1BBF